MCKYSEGLPAARPPAVPQCHNIIWTFLHHLIELAIAAGRNRRASNQKESLRSRPSPADICNYWWRKMGWDWSRSCEGWSESLPGVGRWLKHLQPIRLVPLITAMSAGGECVVKSACLTSISQINKWCFRFLRWFVMPEVIIFLIWAACKDKNTHRYKHTRRICSQKLASLVAVTISTTATRCFLRPFLYKSPRVQASTYIQRKPPIHLTLMSLQYAKLC